MNRAAQALVLTAIGGIALRVSWTDEYARYVNEWMRWPLFASGLLLVGLAATAAFGSSAEEQEHPTTRVAWLLLVPVLVAFVVQPPALGSYTADRSANDLDASAYTDVAVAPLPEGETTDLPVAAFVARAATDEGSSLADRDVRLTGFVTLDDSGDWYVTRLSIACCAADAAAFRVRVDGAEAPPEEQWVEVTGTWVEGTGVEAGSGEAPTVSAADVVTIEPPKRPYE